MNFLNKRNFLLWILVIALAGGLIRFVNITFASLWADELYSVLSSHPKNSLYTILYMQRTYQPPLYFLVLWSWLKLFAYNEFYARLLSVLGGITAIVVSGFLGKKIKDEKMGFLMALLVAFNPTQIMYSLEARFYIFVYIFATLSLLIYWHILQQPKSKNYLIYVLKACIDATLCYLHHFGIIFVLSQFLFDIYLYFKENDRKEFVRKFGGYIITAILYSPWFFWGLLKGLSTSQFWLKEINILKYIQFNFNYSHLLNYLFYGLIIYYIIKIFRKSFYKYHIFLVICLMVIIIPLLYSILRIPILVDRYSMVMAPALYILVILGFIEVTDTLKTWKPYCSKIATGIFLIILLSPGIYMSFIHKEKLEKQPWREMGQWLKNQEDYEKTKIYSLGILLNKRFTIDFYLNKNKEAVHLTNMKVGEDPKMYLVESNSVWQINDTILSKVRKQYSIKQIPFNKDHSEFGNIYVCEKKPLAQN